MEPVGRTILLVNDDREWCELFSLVLADAGFQPVGVPGLAEAVRVLQEGQVDVAVVDLTLPNREGFAALQAVKRIAGPSTPVVMVAGHADPSDRAEARSLGADELRVLPYDVEDLVKSVVKLAIWGPPLVVSTVIIMGHGAA